jgi:hypothetical protein
MIRSHRQGGLRCSRSRGTLNAAVDDALHLLALPVAGVGQQHLRRLVDAGGGELALGGGEHRLEVAEVGADGLDLGGQNDLMLLVTAWAL